MLTSQMIKDRAKELGIDDIGIGNIERFDNAPPLMSVKNYFPAAKSVIAIVMRIPRGSYRGIEEGTHWHNYTFYAYNRLNTVILPSVTYELSRFIEDFGWEAVPHYPAVPERNPVRDPVAPGKLPPNIVTSIRLVAAGTGVGEIGHSKVFLNKKFGPRLRLSLIFTDAELEPDPILDTGTICIHCGACAHQCPGNAIPSVKDKENRVVIDYGEKQVYYADVHMGRCTLTHHGMNNEISPFLKKAFPNMAFDVRNSQMSEEEAYRLCYPLAQAQWSTTYNDNDNCSEFKVLLQLLP
jgi:epoxyqueuosine reductase